MMNTKRCPPVFFRKKYDRESLPLHIEGSGKETSVLSGVQTCEQEVIEELGRVCRVCKVCKNVQGMTKGYTRLPT